MLPRLENALVLMNDVAYDGAHEAIRILLDLGGEFQDADMVYKELPDLEYLLGTLNIFFQS